MPEFSLVTIVKQRRKQLANLLQSIKASSILPYDIQVVCMDDLEGIVVPEGLNVSLHLTESKDGLPLATARNTGIAVSKTGNVIFIDVDCIVSPTLFATMLSHLTAENIVVAYPLYLPALPDTGNYDSLLHQAVNHPAREHLPVGQPVHHLQFWSLIFAVRKQTFEDIGRFDESFTGYGAEDTDFAMMFHKAGIVQIFVPDYVLHQYHQKHDPPLNHFDAIIRNARRYLIKWKVLPMQRWLNAFREMGLIDIDQHNHITVIKKPSDSQIANSVSPNPY